MPYVVGIVLSLGIALFARRVGFDRDRAFYPTVLIVIASYYVLFAAMSGSVQTVLLESMVMTGFSIAAVVGFKSSAWIVVGGLAGHSVFDVLHPKILKNSGVPVWWPAFCLAYDLGAGGWPRLGHETPADSGSRGLGRRHWLQTRPSLRQQVSLFLFHGDDRDQRTVSLHWLVEWGRETLRGDDRSHDARTLG
jgi:hypothetical protein